MKSKVVAIAVLLTFVLASFAPFAGAYEVPDTPPFTDAYVLVSSLSDGSSSAISLAACIAFYNPIMNVLTTGGVSPFILFQSGDSYSLASSAIFLGFPSSDSLSLVSSTRDPAFEGQPSINALSISSSLSRSDIFSFSAPYYRLITQYPSTGSGSIAITYPVQDLTPSQASALSWVSLSSFVDYASSGSEVPDLSAIQTLLETINTKMNIVNTKLQNINDDMNTRLENFYTSRLAADVNLYRLFAASYDGAEGSFSVTSPDSFYTKFFNDYTGLRWYQDNGNGTYGIVTGSLVQYLEYASVNQAASLILAGQSQSSLAALQSVWADEEDIAFRESLDDTVTAVKDDYYGDDAVFTADTSKGSKQIVSGIGSAWSAGSDITPNQTINVMNNTTAWSQFFTPQMAATMDTVNSPVAISVDNDGNSYAWIDDIPPDEMHVPNIPTYEDLYGGDSR